MTTFLIFLIAFIAVIMVMARRANKRQSSVYDETERVAQETLPTIGGIAEKAHSQRFGRPPTNLPPISESGDRAARTSWYPESRRVAKRHA